MQVYVSALLLSPARSLIRKLFSDKAEDPAWLTIERGVEENWDVSALTFEGHKGRVICVAFSHDSQRLASGSEDGIIKIWDFTTGDCLFTIESQTGKVLTVAFSHDSRQLVAYCHGKSIPHGSKSGRTAISIWETSTGCMRLRIPAGDNLCLTSSIIFSHDSQRLALRSTVTLQIRDAPTGYCLRKFELPVGKSAVDFSYDSKYIAFRESDTVRIWNLDTNHCRTIENCDEWGSVVAFSHDSHRLASTAANNAVQIWDAITGDCLHIFKGHDAQIEAVRFSENSQELACLKGWNC